MIGMSFRRKLSTEAAEAWPFTRVQIADLIEVPVRQVSNWIDRNELWPHGQLKGTRGYYRLSDVFDLAGFGALRIAGVPEQRAAQYTRNFGFYRSFLGLGDQRASFSYRSGKWDVGVYDLNAMVSVVINMRTLGAQIFKRLSISISDKISDSPGEAFLQFQHHYRKLIEIDRLSPGTAPAFEAMY